MADLTHPTNQFEGSTTVNLHITSANTDDWKSWNGFGHAYLRDGLIWQAPIFGIFSPVLNSISPGLGTSRAREAAEMRLAQIQDDLARETGRLEDATAALEKIAEEKAERLPKGQERFVDDEEFVYFSHVDGFFRVPRADWERIFSHFKAITDAEHKQVVELGGLHIVGTERHEARRIDNQLRGRSGRQGDPGSARFYLSLEDNLMRIFLPPRMRGMRMSRYTGHGSPVIGRH